MSFQTVSAMYIVRNEEVFLPYSIRSIYDAVDEIIVVDNASTDKTVEMAKSFDKVKLLQSDVQNDFAQLRNLALQAATGHWVLKIDADEVFYPDLVERLPFLTADQEVDAYTCWYYHLVKDFSHMMNHSDQDPIFCRPFLYRNHHKLIWKNSIHEVLDGVGPHIVDSRLHYVHYSYTKSKKSIKEKLQYYARIEGNPTMWSDISEDEIIESLHKFPVFEWMMRKPTAFTKPHPLIIQEYIKGNQR